MQLGMLAVRGLRDDRKGAMGSIAAFAVLVLVAGVGTIVVFSNQYLTVEAEISEPAYGDPLTATLTVYVTNHADKNLLVEKFEVFVWADEKRTTRLSEAAIQQLMVAPAERAAVSMPLEIHNADALGPTVWVDVEAVWWVGNDHHRHAELARPFSVGGELAKIIG